MLTILAGLLSLPLSFPPMLSKGLDEHSYRTFKELMMIMYANSADHGCWFCLACVVFPKAFVFQERVYAKFDM